MSVNVQIYYYGMLTQVNFNATNLKPFCSKRLIISPTIPLWTPSGLTIMKVLSRGFAMIS